MKTAMSSSNVVFGVVLSRCSFPTDQSKVFFFIFSPEETMLAFPRLDMTVYSFSPFFPLGSTVWNIFLLVSGEFFPTQALASFVLNGLCSTTRLT